MTTRLTWGRRLAVAGTLALIALAGTAVPANADAGRKGRQPGVTTEVPVGYSCFVTFPGGETTVPFGLTFTTTAPQQVAAYHPFTVVLDPQQWTPDPKFNLEVRHVTVKYRLPANTLPVWYRLSGGLNLGSEAPRVELDLSARTLSLTVEGPLPASVPFDLPTVTVFLIPGKSGVAQVATGGTSLTDPSWSWIRTDLEGTQRPFNCNPASPVVFTTTNIG